MVDADNAKVQIVFDNVDITCASSAAVYVKSAEKVFVTLAEGSQNTLRNTDGYVAIDDNNIDAVIFSKIRSYVKRHRKSDDRISRRTWNCIQR